MEIIEFKNRAKLGNSAKQLLNEGLVPAVVYNAKTESYSVAIPAKYVETLLRTATSTTIITAKVHDQDMKVVLKEVERNPLTGQIRHLSFFQIDETKPMLFSIPFNIIGISPAVKNNLGILVKALPALEVRCKLSDLVAQIDIDVSNLEHPGQSISVNDLTLPEGLSLPNEEQAHSAIVTITQLQKVEEEVVATPEEGAEAAPAATDAEATPAE
jgi:large subunit ribosomal protein L25